MPLSLLPHLTAREVEVLALILAGRTNAQIARRLCLAHHTVDNYVTRLIAKFQVGNRAGLVIKVVECERRLHRRFVA